MFEPKRFLALLTPLLVLTFAVFGMSCSSDVASSDKGKTKVEIVDPDTVDPIDFDDDGVPDTEDNCPTIQNPNQEDVNDNGKGDACEDLECARNFCEDSGFPSGSHCDSNALVTCGATTDGCAVETGRTACPSGLCEDNQCKSIPSESSLLMYNSMDSIDKIFEPEFVTEMYPNRSEAIPGESHLYPDDGGIYFDNPDVQVSGQALVVLPGTNFDLDDPGMDGGRMDFKIKFPFNPTDNNQPNAWVMGGWCQYRDPGQPAPVWIEIAGQTLNIYWNSLEPVPFPRRGRWAPQRLQPATHPAFKAAGANEWIHLTFAWRRNGVGPNGLHKDEIHIFVNGTQDGCTGCSDYNVNLSRIGDVTDYCISPPNYQNDPIARERIPFSLDEFRTFGSWDNTGATGEYPELIFPEGIRMKYPEYWGSPDTGMQVENTGENVVFEFNAFNRQSENFSCDLYVDGSLSGSANTFDGAHTEIQHMETLTKGVHKYQIKCDGNQLVSPEKYFCYDVALGHYFEELSGPDTCQITCNQACLDDPNCFCYE